MSIVKQHDKRTNITYFYEVEYYWDKEAKKSRSRRKLIGKLDPETGEMVPTDGRMKRAKQRKESEKNDYMKVKRQFYGATDALHKIARKTGVYSDLKEVFPEHYQQILALAYYLVLAPNNTMQQFEDWATYHYLPFRKAGNLTSQRISDLFKEIRENEKQSFFARQSQRQAKDDLWIYDTTSISSYSKTLSYAQYGHNKEDDLLPQINLGVVLSARTGLPIMYRYTPGNIPDNKTIESLLSRCDDLRQYPLRFVMDRGFYSQDNISTLCSENIEFIMGTKKSLKYVQEAIMNGIDTMEHVDNFNGVYELYCTQVHLNDQFKVKGSKTSHYPMRLNLYYNNEQAAEERRMLDMRLQRWRDEIEMDNKVKENERYYKKYFNGNVINMEQVNTTKKLAGYFAILSNTGMNEREVLELYRNKDIIEKSFNNLKDRLNMRRLRVSSEQSLEGKIFVQFIALILVAYIKKQMEQNDLYQEYTMEKLLATLNRIECFDHPKYGFTIGEVLKKQEKLFEQLNINVPQ